MLYKQVRNNTKGRSNILHQSCNWDGVFTDQEVDRIVAYCAAKEAKVATVSAEATVSEIRKSRVAFLNRDNETAWIFDKLNNAIDTLNDTFYNFELNGYDSIQYGEYHAEEGGKYDFHMDTFLNQNGDTRKLSLSMLLNEPGVDFEGGEFQINVSREENAKTVETKKGRILFFPSFLIHRVAPVTKGVRKSLVIWVTGPKFR
jgi:PKHD-type hydroxylase